MKPQPFYTFDIIPCSVVKEPTSGHTMRYQKFLRYMKELKAIAKGKRFKLSNSFKVVFILPYQDSEAHLDGEPHLTGMSTLVKLVEGLRQTFLSEEDIYRVDASKYWGKKGKIIIRNFPAEDFDYLRQIK